MFFYVRSQTQRKHYNKPRQMSRERRGEIERGSCKLRERIKKKKRKDDGIGRARRYDGRVSVGRRDRINNKGPVRNRGPEDGELTNSVVKGALPPDLSKQPLYNC